MRVLGIDPGTAACGYGIVHESDGRLRAACHGWWHTDASVRLEARLLTIYEGVHELIALHAPDFFDVEMAAILWKKLRRGAMTRQDADDILNDLAALTAVARHASALLAAAARTMRQDGLTAVVDVDPQSL